MKDQFGGNFHETVVGPGFMPNVKKARWTKWFFDKEFRHAVRTRKRVQSGELQMHTVGFTPGGVEIQVPETALVAWRSMPEEAQNSFMESIDAAKDNQGKMDPGWHERIDE